MSLHCSHSLRVSLIIVIWTISLKIVSGEQSKQRDMSFVWRRLPSHPIVSSVRASSAP